MSSPAADAERRLIGPQQRDHRGHVSSASPGSDCSAERDPQSLPRPAVLQFQRRPIMISASKKRPSSNRAAASLRHRPPRPPSSSVHTLLRDRQRFGRPGFLARPGAGVWSPDPLHRAFAGSAHTLRRLELSGELRGHGGCVNTVSCTPDGRYWITGSDDMKLMVSVLLLSGYLRSCVHLDIL